jgi:hypothetical protein
MPLECPFCVMLDTVVAGDGKPQSVPRQSITASVAARFRQGIVINGACKRKKTVLKISLSRETPP